MRRIADEPRRKGPYGDAGEQIADDRRQPQPDGQVAEGARQDEAHRDQRDECGIVMHVAFPSSVTQFNRRQLTGPAILRSPGEAIPPMFRILAIAADPAWTRRPLPTPTCIAGPTPQGTVQYSDRWVPGSVLVKTDQSRATSRVPRPPTASLSPHPMPQSPSEQISQQQRVSAP